MINLKLLSVFERVCCIKYIYRRYGSRPLAVVRYYNKDAFVCPGHSHGFGTHSRRRGSGDDDEMMQPPPLPTLLLDKTSKKKKINPFWTCRIPRWLT